MPDRSARTLETLLKTLPKTREHEYRHLITARAPTELNPGERSDVSWISTECIDRMGEVVLAKGMNDSQFQHNPLVTLGHAYWVPPVGRSLWRKRVKDGTPPNGLVGIKAKTHYPPRPENWPENDAWPPDKVLALIQAGLLQGKSIGFLPLKVHVPDEKEVQKNGWKEQVNLVIDEWLLLEYACVFLPANQDALVESVSKGVIDLPSDFLQAMGLDAGLARSAPSPESPAGGRPGGSPLGAAAGALNQARIVPFTALEEIQKAVARAIENLDYDALAERCVQDSLDRLRGRV
jgi:hypothetical protein